ncbi:MAG: hypothetical protein HY289_02570 [Planctomycetes bacterium]|nr:hypothetical protein [Planctomycetota bacterium]
MHERRRYPLNVDGDFYVEDGMCMACTAPEYEAPELMSFDTKASGGYHCYFKRQPHTPIELENAIMAVAVGCCAGVRYGGDNCAVIQRLVELGVADTCDQQA